MHFTIISDPTTAGLCQHCNQARMIIYEIRDSFGRMIWTLCVKCLRTELDGPFQERELEYMARFHRQHIPQ